MTDACYDSARWWGVTFSYSVFALCLLVMVALCIRDMIRGRI